MADRWIQGSLLDSEEASGKEEIDGLQDLNVADPGEKEKGNSETYESESPKIGEFPTFEEFLKDNPPHINPLRMKVLYAAAVHYYETGVMDPSDEDIISSATSQWSKYYEEKKRSKRDEREIKDELTEAWEKVKTYRQSMWEKWVSVQKNKPSEYKPDIKTDQTEEDSSGGWMRKWENSRP